MLHRHLAIFLFASLTLLQACSTTSVSEAEFDMIPAEELAAVRENMQRRGSPSPNPSSTQRDPATTETDAPEIPEGLWQRLALEFSWNRRIENPRVARYIEQYSAEPELFIAILSRAEPYLYFIAEELAARDMPAELSLLPFVESGYNLNAVSSANAVGLWQFMPATASQYGIQRDWWYDGRSDLLDSTAAALDHLQYLHNRFGGNWELALAAYNAGEGYISRAILSSDRQDYWALDLYTETENYVPKLLAIAELVRAPQHYGIELPEVADEPLITLVDIESQIDLNVAAELADTSYEQIASLNAGFQRWATPPEGPTRLWLPVEQEATFVDALARLPAEERVSYQQYRIRSGDTLSAIAARYDTSVAAIMAANGMSTTFLRAGQELLVPYGSIQPTSSTIPGGLRTYLVRRGDTLSDIANRERLRLQDLIAWNDLSAESVIHPGQALQLSPAPVDIPESNGELQYEVRRGDSLYAIAQRFAVSVADILTWNGRLKGDDLIHPGQTLRVLLR